MDLVRYKMLIRGHQSGKTRPPTFNRHRALDSFRRTFCEAVLDARVDERATVAVRAPLRALVTRLGTDLPTRRVAAWFTAVRTPSILQTR